MSELLKTKILIFGRRIRQLKEEINTLSTDMNLEKEKLRQAMIQNDLKVVEGDDITVKCTRSYSFDVGQLNFIAPALYKKYTTVETITKSKVIINKKDLKKYEPVVFEKCNIENTARLTIK